MVRHLGIAAAILLGALASTPARALDPAQVFVPAVTIHWTFGGARKPESELRLQLNYAADTRVPAFAQWTLRPNGDDRLTLNGLPLHAGNLYAAETDGATHADSGMGPGGRVMLILLGAGGATALVVSSLGHAAHENNPAVDDNQAGVGCATVAASGTCVVGSNGGG